MKANTGQERYLLLDSKNMPLARALLESPADAQVWQIRVLDDKMETVLRHEVVQLVGMTPGAPVLLGRILRSRNDIIAVEKLRTLDEQVRQNLRMPVVFDTFLYPVTGRWRGRRKAESHDLSCGGIAFFCDQDLEQGEQVEVVIPITAHPLVLTCQILRRRTSGQDKTLYAAEFVEMCNDEETLVREAVFNIQLQNRARSTQPDP